MSIVGKSVAAALGLAVVGHGISKGLNNSGATQAFLGAVSGNPNLDRDVLGTNISATDLFVPSPISRLSIAAQGLPGARSGIPRLMGLLSTGFLNKTTLNAGLSRANDPFATGVSTGGNTLPAADGSLVFGMYNSRYGG